MADYYTQFCVGLVADTDAKKLFFQLEQKKAQDWDVDAVEDGEPQSPCNIVLQGNSGYLEDNAGEGGVDYAIEVCQRYLYMFDPKGTVELSWANTCSKSRPDSFSGDRVYIKADSSVTDTELVQRYQQLEKELRRKAPRITRLKKLAGVK